MVLSIYGFCGCVALYLGLVFSLGSFAQEEGLLELSSEAPHVEPPKKKNQLEELFIWKLSDELKLTPSEEKKFGDLVRDLNRRKMLEAQNVDVRTRDFIKSVSKTKDKEFELMLKAYQSYGQTSAAELIEMKKLLGAQRLATYLEIKQELNAKVKSLLIQDKVEGKKDLPEPKIIEEKK